MPAELAEDGAERAGACAPRRLGAATAAARVHACERTGQLLDPLEGQLREEEKSTASVLRECCLRVALGALLAEPEALEPGRHPACRGTRACVTIDRCRHLALQTF